MKSQCFIVSSRSNFIRRPTFQLSGASLPYTECYKYLGHMINSALSDDQDITKQTRSLYARANVIIRKFSHASLNTTCYSELIVLLYMAVSSGVLCSSTHTANYELLIMMPSDNYYMNQDGVVHYDYLCFIMCRHSLRLFVN